MTTAIFHFGRVASLQYYMTSGSVVSVAVGQYKVSSEVSIEQVPVKYQYNRQAWPPQSRLSFAISDSTGVSDQHALAADAWVLHQQPLGCRF